MPSAEATRVGEIWDVDFDPRIEREHGGVHPAPVISNDYFNRAPNGLHFVVPIIGTDRGIRLHLRLNPPEGGLTRPSIIMCDQARSQRERRFRRRRGTLASEVVRRVQAMVGECIDR